MTRSVGQGPAEDLASAASDRRGYVSSSADFDTVYAQNVRFTWRVLRGMGVPDAWVEDAVQDLFVVVHRRLAEFDGRHSIRTWLFAIAYRVAHEHLRRSRHTRGHEMLEPQLRAAGPGPDESAARAEGLRVVCELLAELDDEKRAVLVLADIEGMTAQEIADATGAGINTVYTRLRRARLQLNERLAARHRRTP